MTGNFEDIRITGLNVNATRPSSKGSAMRLMHLSLSHTPPANWGAIFNRERQFPRHSMWRKAWLEGAYIVVDCVPEEIGQYHLADLKQDVNSSNTKYREWSAQVSALNAQKQQDTQSEQARIAEIAAKLKFD